ncbi:MAG TPA: hypothetical protein VFW95_04890 [Candidatus Limnocylindria bacterium]|nr:hypothetical protein [Candidatus Limnocylindria bacterium]
MTDQFVIDLGNDQRAVVDPDDAAWLQEKLRREPGSTRLEIRYDDADTEGHGNTNPRFKVILEGDDDTEGHAIALNFPTREEADAFRKRLMLAGVLAGTIAVGAVGGMGLANMSNDAAGAGAASTAVSGSDWTQVERPDAASVTAAGSAWTSEERPGTAVSDTDGSSATDDAPTLGGPTPR